MNVKLVQFWVVLGLLSASSVCYSQTSLDQEMEELGLSVNTPEIDLKSTRISSSDSTQIQSQTDNSSELVDDQIRVLLKPKRTTVLSSEIGGQIRKLPYDIGAAFGKGDVLVRIGCNGILSEIAISKARLNSAVVDFDSNQSLLNQGGGSKFDVDIARARVAEEKANLKKYQVQAQDCTIHAPYAGKVVTRFVNRYEHVSGGGSIVEIIDDSRLEMELYIPSNWVTRISKKTIFAVHVDEVGKRYEAKVIKINPRVDAGSKTLEIIAELTGRHKELRAGMSGNAVFNW